MPASADTIACCFQMVVVGVRPVASSEPACWQRPSIRRCRPRTSYALTEAGQALAPVLDAIATWAERFVIEPATACEGEPALATPSGPGV
jgi:hypothetical protein